MCGVGRGRARLSRPLRARRLARRAKGVKATLLFRWAALRSRPRCAGKGAAAEGAMRAWHRGNARRGPPRAQPFSRSPRRRQTPIGCHRFHGRWRRAIRRPLLGSRRPAPPSYTTAHAPRWVDQLARRRFQAPARTLAIALIKLAHIAQHPPHSLTRPQHTQAPSTTHTVSQSTPPAPLLSSSSSSNPLADLATARWPP